MSNLAAASQSASTGAAAIVAVLEELGVELAFGLPGVHNLALWSALHDSPIRLVGVRHEQTAVYAADGYARVTGRLGIALVTTGPGAANTLAATGEAYASHSPVVVLATDIPSSLRRPGVLRGALHETRDQAAMFAPIVKRTRVAHDPADLAELLALAAAEAFAPPRGPVYLGIPTDFLTAELPAPAPRRRPAPRAPADQLDGALLTRAAAILRDARRPLIWLGGGATQAGAGPAASGLARALAAPVLETYGGRGLLGAEHPCAVGLPPHLPEAGRLWDEADVVLAIGSDLDGMSTQNWRQPQPPTLLAINVDADDAGKNYRVDLALVGDARVVAERLTPMLGEPRPVAALAARLARIRELERGRLGRDAGDGGPQLLESLAAVVPGDGTIVCDMCVAGYWVGALYPFTQPRRLAYPVGWGTLGFGLPASIGAALAGEQPVLAVVGDGGFMFACGELATIAQEQPNLTVLVVDDAGYGMLRYDQQRAGQARSGVDLLTPDFVALAASFGLRAVTVKSPGAPLRDALAREFSRPGPGLVVLEAELVPPPSTSPRWYRSKSADSGGPATEPPVDLSM